VKRVRGRLNAVQLQMIDDALRWVAMTIESIPFTERERDEQDTLHLIRILRRRLNAHDDD
jgi:hypothetical protein